MRSMVALLSMLALPSAFAEAELTPYKARYATKAMGLNMTLNRTLEENEGVYTLRNRGKVMVASLEEEAIFTIDDGQIRGDSFTYRLGGIVSRERAVDFDSDNGVIHSLKKEQWTDHPWAPDVLDRLSQQEQLRLALMDTEEPPETITFKVVDGDRITERTLALVGKEALETEAGTLATLHYRQVRDDDKRSSDIWLAADYDYLMVQTRHVEKGSAVEVRLVNAVVGGVPMDPDGPDL